MRVSAGRAASARPHCRGPSRSAGGSRSSWRSRARPPPRRSPARSGRPGCAARRPPRAPATPSRRRSFRSMLPSAAEWSILSRPAHDRALGRQQVDRGARGAVVCGAEQRGALSPVSPAWDRVPLRHGVRLSPGAQRVVEGLPLLLPRELGERLANFPRVRWGACDDTPVMPATTATPDELTPDELTPRSELAPIGRQLGRNAAHSTALHRREVCPRLSVMSCDDRWHRFRSMITWI